MRRDLSTLAIIVSAFLLWLQTPGVAQVLHSDSHGVQVEYSATDTGHFTSCSSSPATDTNYTTERIRVWRLNLKITNGSDRAIRPEGPEIATVTVDPDKGSSLGYCAYRRLAGFYKIDGQSDQRKLLFGIALGVRSIPPGRTLSNSTYMYLYESQRPSLSRWQFQGYEFLQGSRATVDSTSRSANPSALDTRRTAATVSAATSSLLLLMDVSGSMAGARLRSAKSAAVETIRKAITNQAEIAVVAFEGDCASPMHSSVGFTRDEGALVAFVNGLTAQGGTPLATALEATNKFMQQHKSSRSRTQMILLLADGDDDCGGLSAVLRALKRENLLYRHETVGLEVSRVARQQLQDIATQSGGNYHNATSGDLSQVFSDAVDLMGMLDMLGRFR